MYRFYQIVVLFLKSIEHNRCTFIFLLFEKIKSINLKIILKLLIKRPFLRSAPKTIQTNYPGPCMTPGWSHGVMVPWPPMGLSGVIGGGGAYIAQVSFCLSGIVSAIIFNNHKIENNRSKHYFGIWIEKKATFSSRNTSLKSFYHIFKVHFQLLRIFSD